MADNNTLETKIALMENNCTMRSNMYEKLESAIEKISMATVEISKILAVQSEKLTIHDKVEADLFALDNKRRIEMTDHIKDINEKITDVKKELAKDILSIESNIMNVLAQMRKENQDERELANVKHKELEDKVGSLERWRWILVGGAAALGWIMNKSDILLQILAP